ncbi:hypothetical protein PB1_16404 [Bacillus methanolicus PB1]|uniref:Uncharacterized protein n=2 Tax=Bacillus methanolicus TaxID=1471 RepID=I3DY35_BACMT|nr:hypothetical protein PB1_16404 [Bacillus methanolicus PB1]
MLKEGDWVIYDGKIGCITHIYDYGVAKEAKVYFTRDRGGKFLKDM